MEVDRGPSFSVRSMSPRWRGHESMIERRVGSLATLIATALMGVLVSGCPSRDLDLGSKAGDGLVALLHDAFNEQDCGRIYEMVDPRYRDPSGRIKFVSQCEAGCRRVGRVLAWEPTGRRVTLTPLGRVVTLEYRVKYERGPGKERLVVRPRTTGYVIAEIYLEIG